MCVFLDFVFFFKASLPDDMLSSESMSSSINKPLKIPVRWALPGGAWHGRAAQNKPIVGVLRAQRTSNDFECIIIQIFQWYSYRCIFTYIYIWIYIYIYHVRMNYTHMAMGQYIHFHISWDIVGTASCQGTDGSNGPVDPSPSMALTNTFLWVKQCHKPPTTGNLGKL